MLPIGNLICCPGHFWSGSLCLFGFGLPVSSVSNFHPATGGRRWSLFLGSLVQSCFGAGRALQTNVTGLCGEHWQCSGHLGLPQLVGVCFPRLHRSGSQLLYMERTLHCVRFQFLGPPQKRGLGWACVLCLPRPSSSGSQELDESTLPGCSAPSPLRGPSLSFLAQGLCAPCVCSRELASSHNPPCGCRPFRISGSL